MSTLRYAVLLAILLLAPSRALGQDEPLQLPVDANEWSIWVANPAQPTWNSSRATRNAMPGLVGTNRIPLDDEEETRRFPVSPISVLQFFGDPSEDVDVELRVSEGSFLAHWPPSTDRGGRLQWFGVNLKPDPPAGLPLAFIPDSHWMQALRTAPALYIEGEERADRFVAYDAEFNRPIPVKLRGGPDEYTLQNLSARRLLDVALIVPTDDGLRVGWLDELPTAAPEADPKSKPDEKKPDPSAPKSPTKPETDPARVDEILAEVGAKPDDTDEPLKPLPPEGDANARAAVDQVLNRPITIEAAGSTRKETLDRIAAAARFRYELDDRAITKANVDLAKPSALRPGTVAARDAIAELLGSVGLSYRVTDTGALFITTSARLAEAAEGGGKIPEGPPVTLTLSQPLPADDPSYRELTLDAYVRRLAGQGLREDVAREIVGAYGESLFRPEKLVVLAHLSRETIDEMTPLDIFPPPRKFARTATLVIHGIDPRLQDQARTLVQRLGDESFQAREAAEDELFALGPVAVPALEDALTDTDVEIVFRAERLLRRLDRRIP